MTILSKMTKTPRLALKDSNCILSWLDGEDSIESGISGGMTSSTTGNFPNRGSLGDVADLRLNTETAYLRKFTNGNIAPGSLPWLNPTYYPHGFSTAETSLGEAVSAITIECWIYPKSSNKMWILHKGYNTGASPWVAPFMSIALLVENYRLESNMATSAAAPANTTSPLQAGTSIEIMIPNNWYHIGLSLTYGGNIKHYMNGIKIYQSPGTYSILWGNHGRWAVGGVGGRTNTNIEGVYGSIQGARVHDVERSETWFMNTYKTGIGLL
jgi:hypothetical protein